MPLPTRGQPPITLSLQQLYPDDFLEDPVIQDDYLAVQDTREEVNAPTEAVVDRKDSSPTGISSSLGQKPTKYTPQTATQPSPTTQPNPATKSSNYAPQSSHKPTDQPNTTYSRPPYPTKPQAPAVLPPFNPTEFTPLLLSRLYEALWTALLFGDNSSHLVTKLRNKIGVTYEEKLERLLQKHMIQIPYLNDTQQRSQNKAKTPDFVFPLPLCLEQWFVRWIDSKMLHASQSTFTQLRKQIQGYDFRYDLGVCIFWCGVELYPNQMIGLIQKNPNVLTTFGRVGPDTRMMELVQSASSPGSGNKHIMNSHGGTTYNHRNQGSTNSNPRGSYKGNNGGNGGNSGSGTGGFRNNNDSHHQPSTTNQPPLDTPPIIVHPPPFPQTTHHTNPNCTLYRQPIQTKPSGIQTHSRPPLYQPALPTAPSYQQSNNSLSTPYPFDSPNHPYASQIPPSPFSYPNIHSTPNDYSQPFSPQRSTIPPHLFLPKHASSTLLTLMNNQSITQPLTEEVPGYQNTIHKIVSTHPTQPTKTAKHITDQTVEQFLASLNNQDTKDHNVDLTPLQSYYFPPSEPTRTHSSLASTSPTPSLTHDQWIDHQSNITSVAQLIPPPAHPQQFQSPYQHTPYHPVYHPHPPLHCIPTQQPQHHLQPYSQSPASPNQHSAGHLSQLPHPTQNNPNLDTIAPQIATTPKTFDSTQYHQLLQQEKRILVNSSLDLERIKEIGCFCQIGRSQRYLELLNNKINLDNNLAQLYQRYEGYQNLDMALLSQTKPTKTASNSSDLTASSSSLSTTAHTNTQQGSNQQVHHQSTLHQPSQQQLHEDSFIQLLLQQNFQLGQYFEEQMRSAQRSPTATELPR